jgi:predicted RNA-binding Zn-ribbon protein involved in translation (DUF1610 family)
MKKGNPIPWTDKACLCGAEMIIHEVAQDGVKLVCPKCGYFRLVQYDEESKWR